MSPAAFDLDHLRAFAAAVRLGELAAAADASGLTEPGIIQAIARLEALTGHNLMSREAGASGPSDAGLLLAARAETALAAIAGIREGSMAQAYALVAFADGDSRALEQVVDLERRSGLLLLTATARGQRLTKHAERLATACRLAIVELQAALDELAVLAGRDQGNVRIAAHPAALARLLPEALARFIAEHPPVVIEVQPLAADSADRLRDGRIDLIVAIDGPALGGFDVTPLAGDPFVIAARAGHPLAGPALPGPARLASQNWVLPAAESDERAAFDAIFIAAGLYPPAPGVTCPDATSALDLARRANLLTLVGRTLVDESDGAMAAIGPALEEGRRLVLAARTDWAPTPAQATFVEELTAAATTPAISF